MSVMIIRRQQRVYCQSKSMLNSNRNEPFKQRTWHFQARIGINLDEIRLEFMINHKVHSIELKVSASTFCQSLAPISIHENKPGAYHISRNPPHLFHNVFLKVILLMRLCTIKIPLKLWIRDLITLLILAIILTMFLNSIISQVYKVIIKVVHIKPFTGGPDIPRTVPVPLHDAINCRDEHVVPNVKFPVIVQERFEVLLDYERLGLPVLVEFLVFHQALDLACRCHWYAVTTIGVLSRLDDPNSVTFLQLLLVEHFYTGGLLVARNYVVCVG